MSIIWTTVAIVAFLFPGVFFFIGLATYERLSRDIIRSGVISEIALATAVALVLHLVCLSVLSAFGFRLSAFVSPFVHYSSHLSAAELKAITQQLMPAALYLLITAALGLVLGAFASWLIVSGRLRLFLRHKWIYDVVDHDRRRRIVGVFVMTTTILDDKALMYRGRLYDISLGPEGKIAYVTLKNCSRFFMGVNGGVPELGPMVDLFEGQDAYSRVWDYLLIDGDNIANILFDPSAESLDLTEPGFEALQKTEQEARARQAGLAAGRLRHSDKPSRRSSSPASAKIPWYRR